MRYLDTGRGTRNQTLGAWLERALLDTATGAWMQSGYFGFESLSPLVANLRRVIDSGHPVHFVLGSNMRSLAAADLRQLSNLLGTASNSSLTVVSYDNALFHPKTYVTRGSDAELEAYVGSANLTGFGMGMNVEAGIALSTKDGDDREQIEQIIESVASWSCLSGHGVFSVKNAFDIDDLVTAGIVATAPIRFTRQRAGETSNRASTPMSGLGHRGNLFPTVPFAPFASTSLPIQQDVGGPSLVWRKKLSASDAQEVRGNSNPTGKLRLAKADHDIDHKTWFREVFFDGVSWRTEMRGDKPYEVALVPFDVVIDDVEFGIQALVVDHAPHRVAGQHNVPTVLAWGYDLSQKLASQSYTNRTVTLYRTSSGTFRLTISN